MMAALRVTFIIVFGVLVLFHSCNSTGVRQLPNGKVNDLSFDSTIPGILNITLPDGTVREFDFLKILPTKKKSVDCFGLGTTLSNFFTKCFREDETIANQLDINFLLSSRKQPRRVLVATGKQFSLESADFVFERKTVFIVHGFLSSGDEEWVKKMEAALLTMEDVNVVVVDWAARGNTFNYYKAAVNTITVGGEIAKLLHHIVYKAMEINGSIKHRLGKLHLIGHSLGAHICGIAAYQFKARQDEWQVDRISGLDPARPCFNNTDLSVQLDKTDAPFVDIIHTNDGFGISDPIGHVDFYVNGGRMQPGCHLTGTSYIPKKKDLDEAVCSHGRAYQYFTESVVAAANNERCKFWGHSWDQTYQRAVQAVTASCNARRCTEMGIKAENYPHRGIFFTTTSRNAPFCAVDSEDQEEVKNQLKVDFKISA